MSQSSESSDLQSKISRLEDENHRLRLASASASPDNVALHIHYDYIVIWFRESLFKDLWPVRMKRRNGFSLRTASYPSKCTSSSLKSSKALLQLTHLITDGHRAQKPRVQSTGDLVIQQLATCERDLKLTKEKLVCES